MYIGSLAFIQPRFSGIHSLFLLLFSDVGIRECGGQSTSN
jgi:hypothetical protein